MPEPSGQPPSVKYPALFMGTPQFAIPSLIELYNLPQIDLRALITQPDRPRGRGMKSVPPPVKKVALKAGLEVYQPGNLKWETVGPFFESLPPLDFVFVVAYGKKIPSWLLELPKYGCINLHPSLLPKYRGGAPMRRAIFNGDRETGVTTMYLDEGWDTGDLILQKTIPLTPDFDHGQLSETLASEGAALMVETVHAILEGNAPKIPQDESKAINVPLLKPEEEWIDWAQSAEVIERKVRGLSPEPAAKTMFRDDLLKLFRVEVIVSEPSETPPGTVVSSDKKGIAVATGQGSVRLLKVQPQGKRVMSGIDFRNGHRVEVGERLFSPSPDQLK